MQIIELTHMNAFGKIMGRVNQILNILKKYEKGFYIHVTISKKKNIYIIRIKWCNVFTQA